jgi:hypothetical protein
VQFLVNPVDPGLIGPVGRLAGVIHVGVFLSGLCVLG